MTSRPIAALTASIVLALGATACSSTTDESDTAKDSTSSAPATTDALDGVTVTGDFGEEPEIEVADLTVDEPVSAVVIPGSGEEVADDSSVNYRFRIVYAKDGTDVSGNYSEEAPQKLDVTQQAPFITDAVVGATIGTRVAIALKVKDLVGDGQASQYGMKGADDLVMVLDLISMTQDPLDGPEGDVVDPPADAPTITEEDGVVTGIGFDDAPKTPSDELQVITLIEGSGDEVAEDDNVTVDYFGTVYGDGKAFDESYSAEPVAFPLTQGSLIDGWVEGLQGVTVGSRVMLIIPADQAYGDQDSGDIPAGSTLVFVIDVLGANL
ncbi:peptidylprolyl isomerase [Nocardioides exalbidus]|uniref:peptidylprolyl isomerase n=1 Tax=Nocardioides exalbidus TaxID=402596 RepID=A0A1H4YN08_9ACTN|nr:FKBP-type peptidyl-prolyl cis-trans isomerase [Nocardioides exalbidus]SED19217.1 peptidylprolyl isomerase [Nocardioides exalbidus]